MNENLMSSGLVNKVKTPWLVYLHVQIDIIMTFFSLSGKESMSYLLIIVRHSLIKFGRVLQKISFFPDALQFKIPHVLKLSESDVRTCKLQNRQNSNRRRIYACRGNIFVERTEWLMETCIIYDSPSICDRGGRLPGHP